MSKVHMILIEKTRVKRDWKGVEKTKNDHGSMVDSEWKNKPKVSKDSERLKRKILS